MYSGPRWFVIERSLLSYTIADKMYISQSQSTSQLDIFHSKGPVVIYQQGKGGRGNMNGGGSRWGLAKNILVGG